MNIKKLLTRPSTKLRLKSLAIAVTIVIAVIGGANILLRGMPGTLERQMNDCVEIGGGWDKATQTCSR